MTSQSDDLALRLDRIEHRLGKTPKAGRKRNRNRIPDRIKQLDAPKLEQLGLLVCGHLWQSELSRQLGVSRQTLLGWTRGEYSPRQDHTTRAKSMVKKRIDALRKLYKTL